MRVTGWPTTPCSMPPGLPLSPPARHTEPLGAAGARMGSASGAELPQAAGGAHHRAGREGQGGARQGGGRRGASRHAPTLRKPPSRTHRKARAEPRSLDLRPAAVCIKWRPEARPPSSSASSSSSSSPVASRAGRWGAPAGRSGGWHYACALRPAAGQREREVGGGRCDVTWRLWGREELCGQSRRAGVIACVSVVWRGRLRVILSTVTGTVAI